MVNGKKRTRIQEPSLSLSGSADHWNFRKMIMITIHNQESFLD